MNANLLLLNAEFESLTPKQRDTAESFLIGAVSKMVTAEQWHEAVTVAVEAVGGSMRHRTSREPAPSGKDASAGPDK